MIFGDGVGASLVRGLIANSMILDVGLCDVHVFLHWNTHGWSENLHYSLPISSSKGGTCWLLHTGGIVVSGPCGNHEISGQNCQSISFL